MALSQNRDVDHYIDQEIRSFQVAAGQHVYKGALVGLGSAGYARPLTAGDAFIGIAYEEMDNSSGGDGDVSVRLYTLGDFGLSLAGAGIVSIGRPVFASDDGTLTMTGDGNSYVGVIQDVVTNGEIILRIDPGGRRIKTVTHAVEEVSAGADVAERAMHAFGKEGWIVAARIVNQATAAAGIDDSNTCVVTVSNAGGTVATETFDSTTTFPAANGVHSLGAISNIRIDPDDVLTVAVTNGATADPGPFIVEVDYI